MDGSSSCSIRFSLMCCMGAKSSCVVGGRVIGPFSVDAYGCSCCCNRNSGGHSWSYVSIGSGGYREMSSSSGMICMSK